ncbi:MAG: phosphonoacetaldehyde reductase, partial [bacterium]
GKQSYGSSGAEKILSEILRGTSVYHFNDFSENPKIEDIKKGIDIFKNSSCDTVISVGGGSVIDMAKSINILASQPSDIKSIIEDNNKILNKGKPLIAVPTTSGAGSEATHFAVVYIGKEKYSLAHDYILPDVSIIDPTLTYKLPSNVTATSGIDAFSQAIESYWNVNATTDSKQYASESIKLVLNNLTGAVNNPDASNRSCMSEAAHLAGQAINITKTTAPHAISYSMTSYFGIPHGQAVCITLAEFLEYNFNVTENDVTGNKNPDDVKSTFDELLHLLECKNIADAKRKITELIISINLKTRLSELGITGEAVKIIAENVNTQRLNNNPRIVTQASLRQILSNIL